MKKTILLLTALFALPAAMLANEVLYKANFSDEAGGFQTWGVQGATDMVTLRSGSSADERYATTVVLNGSVGPDAVRIAGPLFPLEPGMNYALKVVYRAPELLPAPGKKGRVRLVVTDSKWNWSSPLLVLTKSSADWTTFTANFTAPEAAEKGGFRFRIEFLDVTASVELGELTVKKVEGQ